MCRPSPGTLPATEIPAGLAPAPTSRRSPIHDRVRMAMTQKWSLVGLVGLVGLLVAAVGLGAGCKKAEKLVEKAAEKASEKAKQLAEKVEKPKEKAATTTASASAEKPAEGEKPADGDKSDEATDKPAPPGETKLALFHRRYKTKLVKPPPTGGTPPEEPPAETGLLRVKYKAPVGELWAYVGKDPGDGKKHPAVVYAHGGFDFRIGDIAFTAG